MSHVGIAASMEPVSAEPPISVEPIASLPTVEKIYAPNVYPFPPVTSKKVLIEEVTSKPSKDVLEQDARDGERQRSPEPRIPRFPPERELAILVPPTPSAFESVIMSLTVSHHCCCCVPSDILAVPLGH